MTGMAADIIEWHDLPEFSRGTVLGYDVYLIQPVALQGFSGYELLEPTDRGDLQLGYFRRIRAAKMMAEDRERAKGGYRRESMDLEADHPTWSRPEGGRPPRTASEHPWPRPARAAREDAGPQGALDWNQHGDDWVASTFGGAKYRLVPEGEGFRGYYEHSGKKEDLGYHQTLGAAMGSARRHEPGMRRAAEAPRRGRIGKRPASKAGEIAARKNESKTPVIRSTYDQMTPESAADGDSSDRGWLDEEGVPMTPEDYESDETVVSKAVKYLRNAGVLEASSTAFHKGVWYSTGWDVIDYGTGTEEQKSYHLSGFTEEQEREIYKEMFPRRAREADERVPVIHEQAAEARRRERLVVRLNNEAEARSLRNRLDETSKRYSDRMGSSVWTDASREEIDAAIRHLGYGHATIEKDTGGAAEAPASEDFRSVYHAEMHAHGEGFRFIAPHGKGFYVYKRRPVGKKGYVRLSMFFKRGKWHLSADRTIVRRLGKEAKSIDASDQAKTVATPSNAPTRKMTPKVAEIAEEDRKNKVVGYVGDVNWTEYGGGPIYVTDGDYILEYLEPGNDEGDETVVYRVDLRKQVPDWGDVKEVASSSGQKSSDLRAAFMSDDPFERAYAYQAWAGHYGWIEFDSDPLMLSKGDVSRRYFGTLEALKKLPRPRGYKWSAGEARKRRGAREARGAMTIEQAKAELRPLDIVLRHDASMNEFRVNFRKGDEATAYYTNDLADAVATGKDMAARRSHGAQEGGGAEEASTFPSREEGLRAGCELGNQMTTDPDGQADIRRLAVERGGLALRRWVRNAAMNEADRMYEKIGRWQGGGDWQEGFSEGLRETINAWAVHNIHDYKPIARESARRDASRGYEAAEAARLKLIRGGGQPIERLDRFTTQYIATALWSSNDNSDDSGGDPLDKNYGFSDIAHGTLERMKEDCARFQRENEELLKDAYYRAPDDREGSYDSSNAGHDFWLTRNRHGAGFWDRRILKAGDLGKKLTDAAHAFGEVDLYVGDDKKIYQAGAERAGRHGMHAVEETAEAHELRKVGKRWAFVSKHTGKPLAYYRGSGKPSRVWVNKQERRVQFFKHQGQEGSVGPYFVVEKATGKRVAGPFDRGIDADAAVNFEYGKDTHKVVPAKELGGAGHAVAEEKSKKSGEDPAAPMQGHCTVVVNKGDTSEAQRSPACAPTGIRIETHEDVWKLLHERYATLGHELFEVILVTNQAEMMGSPITVASGQPDRVSVDIEQIVGPIIGRVQDGAAAGAKGFIVAHVHPSSGHYARPSAADKRLTEDIRKAAEIGCPSTAFMDHIVVSPRNKSGKGEYYSFTAGKSYRMDAN